MGQITDIGRYSSYLFRPRDVWEFLLHRAIGYSKKDLETDWLWPIRKHEWIWPQYRIEGCSTYNHRDLLEMKIPNIRMRSLQDHYDELLKQLRRAVERGERLAVLRLGDGEATFLKGNTKGNVGRRHFTDGNIEAIDLDEWQRSYRETDIRCFDINWSLRRHWVPLEGEDIKSEFVPLHVVYAMVATRDVLQIGSNTTVGLVGPRSKLNIVEELMQYDRYRSYLGVEEFEEYLYVPETGACNDTDGLLKDLKAQQGADCDLYLVGMGISKLRLLAPLRDAFETVMVDIGSGIDALAGIIPKDRPFFGEWKNYKLAGYDYEGIDRLSQYMPEQKLQTFELADDVVLG